MRLIAVLVLALIALPGLAQDARADERETRAAAMAAQDRGPAPPGALACSGCHIRASSLPLDSLSAEEILAAMVAFKSGAREATLMNRIAAGFDEAELAAIAAWIAQGE